MSVHIQTAPSILEDVVASERRGSDFGVELDLAVQLQ